jgi:hypothetical protein
MANGSSSNPPPEAPAYMPEALDDAERLLKYAAEIGVPVDAATRDNVWQARAVGPAGWDQTTVNNLLTALTQLAALLKPVTAESLKKSDNEDEAEPTLRRYWILAVCLGLCILFFSFTSFITTAFCTAISAKIDLANGLAAKLRVQLGPSSNGTNAPPNVDPAKPPMGVELIDVITELQQYASTIRDINARAQQLNWFIGESATEYHLEALKSTNQPVRYKEFQLPVGIPNLWEAEGGRTELYQHVRAFAQSVIDDVSTVYGAFGSCVLPVLYALFGTCAYLLRKYEQQMKARTFIPNSGDAARFVIAGICGAVVGLFNFTVSQGTSVSPLAIAFLVGYGVDVFFTFLESLLQTFTKGKPPPP